MKRVAEIDGVPVDGKTAKPFELDRQLDGAAKVTVKRPTGQVVVDLRKGG